MTVGRHSASISGVPLGGHDVVIRRNQRCSLGRSRPGADRAADASRAALPPRRRSDVLRPHRVGPWTAIGLVDTVNRPDTFVRATIPGTASVTVDQNARTIIYYDGRANPSAQSLRSA